MTTLRHPTRYSDALHRVDQIREDIEDRVDEGDVTVQRAAKLRVALASIVV